MCWKGKCLYCIKVETGTMIFAIINVVVAALFTLASVILLIVFNVVLENVAKDDIVEFIGIVIGYKDHTHAIASAVGNILLGVLTLVIVVNFIFAVILADGICKKVPSKIKVYFAYGVFLNVCWYIVLIGFWASSGSFTDIVPMFIIQLFFTSMLVMIRMTYLKVNNGVVYVYGQAQENPYQSLVVVNAPV